MVNSPHRHSKTEKTGSLLKGGQVALGVSLGVVLSFASLVFFNWSDGSFFEQGLFNVAPEIVALLVAATSTVLSTIALKEQRKLREAGTDPVVIVHFGQRKDARELVTVKLSNVGAGAAMNVFLTVECPDVKLSDYRLITNIFERHHPFRTILQGQSIEFSFAMGFNLLGENVLPPFNACVAYSDIEGNDYTGEFQLDVREMERLGAEQSLESRRTKATEAVSKTLSEQLATTDKLLLEVSAMKDSFRKFESVRDDQIGHKEP